MRGGCSAPGSFGVRLLTFSISGTPPALVKCVSGETRKVTDSAAAPTAKRPSVSTRIYYWRGRCYLLSERVELGTKLPALRVPRTHDRCAV